MPVLGLAEENAENGTLRYVAYSAKARDTSPGGAERGVPNWTRLQGHPAAVTQQGPSLLWLYQMSPGVGGHLMLLLI